MKKKLLYLFVLLAFAACKNEADVTPNVSEFSDDPKKVEVNSGILKFENKQHLKNVVNVIAKSEDPLNWKPGFSSLLKRQMNIPADAIDKIGATGQLGSYSDVLYFRISDSDTVLTKVIDDPMLASVLNENNQVIIGDTVYSFGLDKVYFTHVANLKSFLAQPSSSGNSLEMKREYATTVIAQKPTSSRLSEDTRVFDNTIEYERNNRRFVAEFVRHNSGIYQSLVVKVRSQKKNWIGWSGTSAPMLSFSAHGVFYQANYYVQFPFEGSRIGYNVEEVSMFVAEGYNVATDWVSKVGSADCIGTNNVRYQFSF